MLLSLYSETLMDFTSLSTNALEHRFTRQFMPFTSVLYTLLFIFFHSFYFLFFYLYTWLFFLDALWLGSKLECWLRFQFLFNTLCYAFVDFHSAPFSPDRLPMPLLSFSLSMCDCLCTSDKNKIQFSNFQKFFSVILCCCSCFISFHCLLTQLQFPFEYISFKSFR